MPVSLLSRQRAACRNADTGWSDILPHGRGLAASPTRGERPTPCWQLLQIPACTGPRRLRLPANTSIQGKFLVA
jgi:hypothetical protein